MKVEEQKVDPLAMSYGHAADILSALSKSKYSQRQRQAIIERARLVACLSTVQDAAAYSVKLSYDSKPLRGSRTVEQVADAEFALLQLQNPLGEQYFSRKTSVVMEFASCLGMTASSTWAQVTDAYHARATQLVAIINE